jgi:antitoxin VapB
VFQRAVTAYAEAGFADEWRLHHQGGTAGYEPREYLGLPGGAEVVIAGQAYAWNPSITGTKSEDTILVGEAGNEVLTTIEGWPMVAVELAGGEKWMRPAVLEVL